MSKYFTQWEDNATFDMVTEEVLVFTKDDCFWDNIVDKMSLYHGLQCRLCIVVLKSLSNVLNVDGGWKISLKIFLFEFGFTQYTVYATIMSIFLVSKSDSDKNYDKIITF